MAKGRAAAAAAAPDAPFIFGNGTHHLGRELRAGIREEFTLFSIYIRLALCSLVHFFTIILCLICISSALPDSDPDMRRRAIIYVPGKGPSLVLTASTEICCLTKDSPFYVHLHRCTASFCSYCFI